MSEEWKPIAGFEARYAVSDQGRVINRETARPLKPIRHHTGYYTVNLYAGGKGCSRRIHRLVAAAFTPNPNLLPDVNHIDGVKSNNTSANLEWCSEEANNQHAFDVGLNCIIPVIGTSIVDGVTEVRFASMKAADLYFSKSGKPGSRVSLCVAGKIHSAHGHSWRRAE